MLDKELIKNKIVDLTLYYKKLEKIIKSATADIIKDDLKLHSTERLFQLIVDTALDINTHFIAELGISPPSDYYNTFISLAENKVLPMEFSLKIASSVGLRNLVVHKYGKVDVRRMVDDIKKEIKDYLLYVKHINEYITKI